MNKLIELINKYDNIVIFRHIRPDMDALGSQIGLKNIIKDNFENKNVYVVGDMGNFKMLGEMDIVDDEIINNSLAIIVDVAVISLVSDNRFLNAKERYVIDHHKNDCDIENSGKYVDTSAVAATQLVCNIATSCNLKISSTAATCLYAGLITDSGRFMFSLSEKVFETAAILMKNGANYKYVYDNLYSESLFKKQMRAYFTSKIQVNELGFAHIINTREVYKKYDVDTFTISRGMVSVMSDIDEIKIWANFTFDKVEDKILCEFRSKNIEIVDIAKKYGGGGHLLACGCTIYNKDDIDNIIKDFNDLLKG